MARFLKLTNSYKGPNGCESIAINIDQIVSIVPASMATSDRYENPQTWITTTHAEEAYCVQETFDKITNSLPN